MGFGDQGSQGDYISITSKDSNILNITSTHDYLSDITSQINNINICTSTQGRLSDITSHNNNINTITQDGPLSLDECFSQLSKLQDRALPPVLVSTLRDMHLRANNSESSKVVFEFAKQMKEENLVKIVSTNIPDGILPNTYTGKLYDTKVHSSPKNSDDKIYEENPDIRDKIHRGTTFMELENDGKTVFELAIYANKKFTGGLGDDDDCDDHTNNTRQGENRMDKNTEKNERWRNYCLQDPDTAEKIVCTEKLNGEAAHFSGRFIEGQFYIIAGSKFVHMLIRNEDDIKLYNGDRYNVARTVATAVCRAINALQESQRKILTSLLHQTKCTVVCELLQPEYQHIVNLSNLSEPEIHGIFLTPTANALSSDTSLLAVPPHHAIDLLRALGLRTVNYEIKSVSEGMQIRNRIRQELHKEGEVLYYVTKSECTIGLVKTKTLWFIILRALREKATYCFTTAKKRQNWKLEDRVKSTLKRFDELQDWLKFPDDYLVAWKDLASGLLPWLDKEIREGRQDAKKIRPMFPRIWDNYLKYTNKSDNIFP